MTGRKRHILVDTQGNLVVVIAHPANIQDRDGADWVLEAAVEKSSRLRHIWADSGYRGELVEWWQDEEGITIEIAGKQPGQRTFVVGPRRWVVKRSFAILGRARRLSKDYEIEDLYSEAMVYLASIGSLLRRLAPNSASATTSPHLPHELPKRPLRALVREQMLEIVSLERHSQAFPRATGHIFSAFSAGA